MSKSRKQIWIALIALPPFLLVAFIMGLNAYMKATAKPLHPDAQSVPMVTDAAASRKWVAAVEQARQVVRTSLLEQNLPGLSVAVGVGDEVVWTEGVGYADLESRLPVAPNMRFRLGTASTVLTSAAVGLLLEKKRLDLDDEIQMHVSEFPKKQWPVTVRQLMGHVAGIRNDGGDEGPLYAQRCGRPVEALQAFADRSLLFEPGTEFRYSSYGWILMSAAIEAAAGEPFLSFMREQVFRPLGMDDTTADSAQEPVPDRATPYFPKYAADPFFGPDRMRPVDYSCYAGASVFLSTAADLVRFGLGINNGKLLKPATVDLLQTSQRLRTGEETGYGLGWDLETVTLAGQQTRVIGHDGDSLGGMVASLLTFRDRGLVIAVISNTSYADTFGIGVKIAEVFAAPDGGPARR